MPDFAKKQVPCAVQLKEGRTVYNNTFADWRGYFFQFLLFTRKNKGNKQDKNCRYALHFLRFCLSSIFCIRCKAAFKNSRWRVFRASMSFAHLRSVSITSRRKSFWSELRASLSRLFSKASQQTDNERPPRMVYKRLLPHVVSIIFFKKTSINEAD